MRVTMETINGPEDDQKTFDKGLAEGLRAGGLFWHRTFARGHFDESAVGKYGYQKRTPWYERRKKRDRHHNRPLVWSWDSFHQIMSTPKPPRIMNKAPGKYALMTLTAPEYFYKYHKGTQADKAAEMVLTLDTEANDVVGEVTKVTDGVMARANVRKRKTL